VENSDCNDSRGMVGAAVDLTAYQNLWHIEEVSLIRSAINITTPSRRPFGLPFPNGCWSLICELLLMAEISPLPKDRMLCTANIVISLADKWT
jgi:hypothetical protein